MVIKCRPNNAGFLFDMLRSGPCNAVHVQHQGSVMVPPRHVITNYTSESVPGYLNNLHASARWSYQNTRSSGRRPRQPPLSSASDQSDSQTQAEIPLTCWSLCGAGLCGAASPPWCVLIHMNAATQKLWCNTTTWAKMRFYPPPGICTGVPLSKIQPIILICVDRFDKPCLLIINRPDQAGAQRNLRNPG